MPNNTRRAADPPRITIVPYRFEPVAMQPPRAERQGKDRDQPPYEGFISFQGLLIDVENAAGSTRSGVGPDGTPWSTTMLYPYGEIRGTEGADGDRVDVYVGPNAVSPLVVVVHQQDPDTQEYDEDKCMVGWDDETSAVAAYLAHYDRPGFYQGHRGMPIGSFWTWLRDPATRGRRIEASARRLTRRTAAMTSGWGRPAAGIPIGRAAAGGQRPAPGRPGPRR